MRSQSRWARAAVGSVLVAVCASACADVLDIQDPKTRTPQAGAAGEDAAPNTAGTATGGGGTANDTLRTPGSAGEGGNTAPGGAGAGAGAGGTAGAGGEAGSPTTECQPDEGRCGGEAQKTPEICDETGHWIANPDEADGTDGDCAMACLEGKCTECSDSDVRCTPCAADAVSCDTNLPQRCVEGVWTNAETACGQYCDAGICVAASSCDAVNKERTTCSNGESCCRSLLVPGGSFKRDFDGSDDYGDDSFPADIGPFLLDKFEVTVGRVRQFVTAYEAIKTTLKNGSGRSPHIPDDAGWDTVVNVLPDKQEDLLTELKSCAGATWSDVVNANNDVPLNCVSFNVAYAFCIWDRGRLPTEAEWNFAAAGGDEQRAYPWKAPLSGPAITDEYANYGNANLGPIAVGSKPLGDGRWGHSDLSGNVVEWTLDYYGDYPTLCSNCLNSTAAEFRSQRGGAYSMPAEALFVSVRGALKPASTRSTGGFRCARDPN
jgi:formylglycine-generating enzyme required for sulfatase activity